MRERISRVASRVFLTSSRNVNSLQWSSPHQLIYVGATSVRHYRRLSNHKSSKNLQYTTTPRLHIVNISQNSAHHLLSFLCRKHATEDSKASPRDAIDTAGAASSESSASLHRGAKYKTLAHTGEPHTRYWDTLLLTTHRDPVRIDRLRHTHRARDHGLSVHYLRRGDLE